ncbi:MAG: coenzyme F420-0:L-glutamate ligase [Sinobacteraceae bacterium]|nr:coenzyme F420-0:L-glutamate ligase [Nevskiaceae bacterium]MCP5467092.1 coenzyme F420-0:L-glutamate ligase [Nevskiaceae bacterium]MCP5472632.1 coenzyme F420-0:L-glutamate ligase [Nevskiaceae bacterium]
MGESSLALQALPGLAEVLPGEDLAPLLCEALARAGMSLAGGDVLVVAQKIVSKAEGRFVDLRDVEPSAAALQLAASIGKDPRFVEVVLRESSTVVRAAPNVLITRHRLGHVMANAGIDRSNLPAGEPGAERVLLLPVDPDASARALRAAIKAATDAQVGVVISDSFGRPWRIGTVNVALGVAGLPAVLDLRGGQDRHGRRLETTQVALADALAAAAGIVMGEATESTPVVRIRGLHWSVPGSDSRALLRPVAEDLFQ